METATLTDGRTVTYLPDVIGEGGMKKVYLTADRRSVVCFFKDQGLRLDPNRLARLQAILGKFNPTTDPATGPYFRELFCWPTGIVVAPQFGVLAPAYAKNFFFAGGPWQGKEKEGRWFSSPKLRKLLPAGERGHWGNYLQVCLRMARAVRKLHRTGLAHSDLSSKNVLIDPPGGRCTVIDIDALVVPGVFAPDVLGTPGYIAPEVLATQHLPFDHKDRKLPSNRTDLHALAVLVYEYLLRRHPLRGPKVNGRTTEEDELLSLGAKALFIEHPRDTSNHVPGLAVGSRQLGPYLPALFERAFVDGLHQPADRPGADDWESALARSQDLLLPCGNPDCDEKWFLYAGDPPTCPWCRWQQREPVPVLEFHYPLSGRRGQYRPEGHRLAAHDQRRLHRWHVYRHVRPGEGVDEEVLAYVARQHGRWLLVNRALDSLVSPAGNPVARGQACALNDGDELLLAQEEHGRLVTVRMSPAADCRRSETP
jgi:serine/threonine protein kinase